MSKVLEMSHLLKGYKINISIDEAEYNIINPQVFSVITTANRLNVRENYGTKPYPSSVVTTLPKDTLLTIDCVEWENNYIWGRIHTEDVDDILYHKWVCLTYTKKVGDEIGN